jgi:hypothetical protein
MKNIILYISILVLFSCAGKKQQDTGLAAYWSFDDTTSAAIKESSGSGLRVLNKGATPTDGYRGKAMKFDGASVLEVKYIPLLDSFARGITIAAWIKKDTAHLAGTYDNDTLKLYKNGILIKSAFCKGPFIFQDKNPLFIGGNSNNKNHSTVDCFKGSIDEVRIYKRALVENEIKSLLN